MAEESREQSAASQIPDSVPGIDPETAAEVISLVDSGAEARVKASKSARTRLTDALISLTARKPLSSISITELCEEAGVSRMAFYRNFQSLEEILTSRLNELVDEYRVYTRPLLLSGELWYSVGHLTICFSFFKEHSDFADCLLACGFGGMLEDVIAGFMSECWGDGSREIEYVLAAFAGTICSAYRAWARHGFEESPYDLAVLVGKYHTVPSRL